MAIDGKPQTMWHTKWDKSNVLPQSITLNLGGTFTSTTGSYVKLEATAGVNGWGSAAEINVNLNPMTDTAGTTVSTKEE